MLPICPRRLTRPAGAPLLAAALALFSLICFVRPAVAQAELRQVATELATKLCAEPDVLKLKGERLMIAEFDNINGKGDAVPRILQEMLTTAFVKAKILRVVERAQMDKALKELRLSLSDLVDPENRKKLGKILGATHILVGSVSEGARSVSIDARIVAVETGESIAAQDASVASAATEGTGTATNPPVGGAGPGKTPETDPKPGVDLNAKGNPTSAGQWIGKKPDMGLLGGTDIRIAWREKLPQDGSISFAAGDLVGDKTQRLAVIEGPADSVQRLAVYAWDPRRWKYKGQIGGEHVFGPVSLDPGTKPCPSLFTQYEAWAWDGTAYNKVPRVRYESGANACGLQYHNSDVYMISTLLESDRLRIYKVTDERPSHVGEYGHAPCAIADFDGDGQSEVCAELVGRSDSGDLRAGSRIAFWALSGPHDEPKAQTEESFGYMLAAWAPPSAKLPFAVTCRRQFASNDGRTNPTPVASTLHLIQFDGESYPEVWRSVPLDGAILDMKVCDPKGEGEPGLVVLTQTKKGAFLTKYVMAK